MLTTYSHRVQRLKCVKLCIYIYISTAGEGGVGIAYYIFYLNLPLLSSWKWTFSNVLRSFKLTLLSSSTERFVQFNSCHVQTHIWRGSPSFVMHSRNRNVLTIVLLIYTNTWYFLTPIDTIFDTIDINTYVSWTEYSYIISRCRSNGRNECKEKQNICQVDGMKLSNIKISVR
jgi:hypothetical protein